MEEDKVTVGMFDFEAMMGLTDNKDESNIVEEGLKFSEQQVEEEVEEDVQEIEEDITTEEEKEEEEVIEEQIQEDVISNTNVYSNLAKRYIEMGVWQDAKLEINGEEVVLSELEDIDEETFLNIQKSQYAAFKEDINEKYINKEELDEISLAIIDISKNKGDISRALDIKKRFIDPLEHFDLDNEFHQEELVRQKYLIESNGSLSVEDIDAIIEKRKKDLELDKEAFEYADRLKKGYKTFLENESKRLEQERLEEEKNVKTLRKQVRDSLSNYGLNEASTRSLSNFVGSSEKDPLLEMINDIKKDPDKLAELIFFLNKKEDYIKAISSAATKETSTKMLRTLKFIQDDKKSTKSGNQQVKKEEEEFKLIFK